MVGVRGRWRADCSGIDGLDPHEVAAVGDDLVARWSEPHRRYHGLTHLEEVLEAVDALCSADDVAPASRTVALLAAWFHDAVYDVGEPGTSEARSAQLATVALVRMRAPAEVTEKVSTLVLDTATHDLGDEAAEDPARAVLHDADLWVLAAPLARFDEYCAQVRAEYAHVPAAAYAAGRSRILRPLLARPHLYATRHGRTVWEGAARENLARELTRLAA